MTLSFCRMENFFLSHLEPFIILSNDLFLEWKTSLTPERVPFSFWRPKSANQTNSFKFRTVYGTCFSWYRKMKLFSLLKFSWNMFCFLEPKTYLEEPLNTDRDAFWVNQSIGRGWEQPHLLIPEFKMWCRTKNCFCTWRATPKKVRYVTFFRECWGWGGKPAPMTLKIGTEWVHG